MYFVLLAAAVAILAGVVAVAMGWGGEMVGSRRDLPAVWPRARTASDVAMLRLPFGLFGYRQEATDVALHAIAGLVAERDAEIAGLRDELWRLRGVTGSAVAAPPDGSSRSEPRDGEPQAAEDVSAGPVAEPACPGGDGVMSGHGQVGGQLGGQLGGQVGSQPSPPS